MTILVVDDFKTPYTDVPERASEVVRLKKSILTRGFYRMEGVRGYEYYYLKKPIKITELQVLDGDWWTLMVDDPKHWYGMEELAELTKPSRVLVGGLGLGLILHHLVKRNDIKEIDVVEIDPEIIRFIEPYIPKDDRINIINMDFFTYVMYNSKRYDTTIVDLWVINENTTKEERENIAMSMKVAYALCKAFSRKVLIWGVRGYGFYK